MIGAFGEDGVVAHVLDHLGDIVAVDQLGVAEHVRHDAEMLLDEIVMHGDLGLELLGIEERGQRVRVGLGDDLRAAGIDERLEAVEDLGLVLGELVERDAGDRERNLELALPLLDHFQQQGVHGQVAFAGDFIKNGAVGFHVLVEVALADVEEAVAAQAVGLMDLEIETDRRHFLRHLLFRQSR